MAGTWIIKATKTEATLYLGATDPWVSALTDARKLSKTQATQVSKRAMAAGIHGLIVQPVKFAAEEAGAEDVTIARSTGLPVFLFAPGVYEDASEGWFLLCGCEDAGCVTLPTKTLAREHMAQPQFWCPGCQARRANQKI